MPCSWLIALALAISGVVSLPAPAHSHSPADATLVHVYEEWVWDKGATKEFRIHSSCNATETTQIRRGLAEAVILAEHAKAHILRWGNGSEHYRKYFGNAPSGEAVGYFERIVSGDRGHALFRCDNPDGNCALPKWGGHWRGKNATDETVICPLSYETRRSLDKICALGYTVAGSETNTFFGSDLIHRLYHMPAFGEGHVEHFTEDYAGVLEEAKVNSTQATHDSDSLQYFALEVYAYDIAVPGIGCPGDVHGKASASATKTVGVAAVTAVVPSKTTVPAGHTAHPPSTTIEAHSACHTHDNGDVHCE